MSAVIVDFLVIGVAIATVGWYAAGRLVLLHT